MSPYYVIPSIYLSIYLSIYINNNNVLNLILSSAFSKFASFLVAPTMDMGCSSFHMRFEISAFLIGIGTRKEHRLWKVGRRRGGGGKREGNTRSRAQRQRRLGRRSP